MLTVEEYRTVYKEKWDDFIDTARVSLFMHKRDYMEYHKDRFLDNSLLFFDEEELIAVLPATRKENKLYSHAGLTFGGLILANNIKQSKVCELAIELRKYCIENSIDTLVYKPTPYIYYKQPADDDKYAFFLLGENLSINKIEPATVINLKRALPMAQLRKRQIKKAIKTGIKVREFLDKKDYEYYIDMLNQVLMEHHNTKAVHTYEEIYYLHEKFPDNIKLYMALKDDRPLAGTIIFQYDKVIHTQYLASTELGRCTGALDLIIYELMSEFKEKDYFDFGISSENNGMFLNNGLIQQKEGFGGRTCAYITYSLEFQPKV